MSRKPIIVLSILIALLFVAVLYLLFLNFQKPVVSTIEPPTPTKSAVSGNYTEEEIANHYNGTAFSYPNSKFSGYEFTYPGLCHIKREVSDWLSCQLGNSTAVFVINAGGHGGSEGNFQTISRDIKQIIDENTWEITQIKNLDTNEVFGTYWLTKTSLLEQNPIFGFEFSGVNYSDLDDFNNLVNEILSTFKFF